MIETKEKKVLISTDRGEYSFSFNPSVPYGWEEIQKALAQYIHDKDMARAVSKRDKQAGAVYWIQKQAEMADTLIAIIHKVAGDEGYKGIEWILQHIDLDDLMAIATSILDAYSQYFHDRLQEGLEP